MSTYVPLWTKSNYSFLEGASHPGELVERAHELGLPALALTDRNGIYGLVRAHVRAQELGIQLLCGSELVIHHPGSNLDTAGPFDPETTTTHPLIALAPNRAAYTQLCRLLSMGHTRGAKGQALIFLNELIDFGTELLFLCPDPALLPYLVHDIKHRLYALITRHRCSHELATEQSLRDLATLYTIPTVAAIEVLYHDTSRRPLQDVLTCIRHRTSLQNAGKRLRGNQEHDLKPSHAMAELFADDPASLARTLEIAGQCRFSLAQIRYRYPGERIPQGETPQSRLRQLAFTGAHDRYQGDIPHPVQSQLERELSLIDELDYCGYFLTMWEVVQFCRSQSILCQGRGSAANSIVCYCLGITAIDPVQMDLLFERFLSRERAEPPDIDLDIEHQRREEVIQWVYQRYGRRYAAMVANVIRYRARSAIRDIGRALSIPRTALDRLAKLASYYDGSVSKELFQAAGLDPQTPSSGHLLRLCREITDFPRHLSIHPGGFFLGDEPVDHLVPIEPATMEDRTVIQWDKYDIEDMGLFKVDLLGLGALSMIRESFSLLKSHHHITLDMATVPHTDPKTYSMICKGDTLGVFQIESRAQMAMLPRLRPQTFYDLVIEIAIVRPGPIQGDMVHPYLQRRSGKEDAVYPHPMLKKVLEKTLGVPIFQEQVMKLAILVADYTPGEADQLRRDMAAWKSSGRIHAHRDQLISRMVANGIALEFAQRVFSQIQGFGEYGFPESHAASFALIAYVTAWLRCHYPATFCCALLNAQPMGFYAPSTIIEDAKRHGVTVLPLDIQHSHWNCTLSRLTPTKGEEEPFAVRMGYKFVNDLGSQQRHAIEQALQSGPFTSVEDFVRRTQLSRKALQAIAEAGGFSSVCHERRDALWNVHGLWAQRNDTLSLSSSASSAGEPRFRELSPAEAILWDYRTSHHSTRGHPLSIVQQHLHDRRILHADDINRSHHHRRVDFVGMVICRQRPATASGVTFLSVEDETGIVNVVIWRRVFEAYTVLAKTAMLLGITGKVQAQDGVVHLVAQTLWAPDLDLRPQGVTPRSFR